MLSKNKRVERLLRIYLDFITGSDKLYKYGHKKSLLLRGFVNWLGLEPRTHTLKVYCSTN
jgi:hypothetical protein